MIPDPIADLLARVGCVGDEALSEVNLRQVGEMRSNPTSAWMKFEASQRIELTTSAFEWRARAGPLKAIHVTDAFSDGRGGLEVSLFGLLRLMSVAASADLKRGELMRHLAELAWAPDAIRLNSGLEWRVLDEQRVSVAAGDGASRAEVRITFDREGRIGEVFAPNRPRAIGKRFEACAWRGIFSDYRWFGRRLLPVSAEVGWLDPDYVSVWRGRLIAWSVS